jgi:hypothetical protein
VELHSGLTSSRSDLLATDLQRSGSVLVWLKRCLQSVTLERNGGVAFVTPTLHGVCGKERRGHALAAKIPHLTCLRLKQHLDLTVHYFNYWRSWSQYLRLDRSNTVVFDNRMYAFCVCRYPAKSRSLVQGLLRNAYGFIGSVLILNQNRKGGTVHDSWRRIINVLIKLSIYSWDISSHASDMVVSLWPCVQEVSNSNFNRFITYHESFFSFPQSFQANSGIVPLKYHDYSLPNSYVRTYHLWSQSRIVRCFKTVIVEIWSLNNLRICLRWMKHPWPILIYRSSSITSRQLVMFGPF